MGQKYSEKKVLYYNGGNMNYLMTKLAIIEVELVSLKARHKRTSDFPLNTDMDMERQLLTAQINALEYDRNKINDQMDAGGGNAHR